VWVWVCVVSVPDACGCGCIGSCFTHHLWAAHAAASQPESARHSTQTHNVRAPMGQTFVPCIPEAPSINYLNQPSVISALHVAPQALLPWASCSSTLNYVQYAPTMVRDSLRIALVA